MRLLTKLVTVAIMVGAGRIYGVGLLVIMEVMVLLLIKGLDGIRMLDPSTSRTLRIYSLDTVIRCEAYDSSTLAFWSKSSVDIEPRRIRLQSNSYTTNTLLDTITAANIQFKEMGGRSRPVDAVKVTEQSTEKKKGLGEWMNIIKPVNEEKDHWVPDEAVTKCSGCGSDFSAFNRKHHCRNCGDIFVTSAPMEELLLHLRRMLHKFLFVIVAWWRLLIV